MTKEHVRKLYNDQAQKWSSDEARTMSDLVGRARILDICTEIAADKVVLDLGCGEGYIGRKVAKVARKIIGVDISEEMIKLANKKKGANEAYLVSSMDKLSLTKNTIDLAVAVMSLHYLKNAQDLARTFGKVSGVLKNGGELIFLIPHPLGSLINEKSKHYLHKKFAFNYSQDEGRYFKWKVGLLNGKDALDVGMYFHSIATYAQALKAGGFVITDILEPAPDKTIVKKYQAELEEKIPYFLIIRARNMKVK